MSTTFPLPSSPHWAPITTTFFIAKRADPIELRNWLQKPVFASCDLSKPAHTSRGEVCAYDFRMCFALSPRKRLRERGQSSERCCPSTCFQRRVQLPCRP